MYFKLSTVVIACSLFSGWLPAQGQRPSPKPKSRTQLAPQLLSSLDVHEGLTYARYGDRSLELDLYRPKSTNGKLPAVVCIHGGGWANGNRQSHRNLAKALAARGFVTVTISYRLSGEAEFPAAIHDCKAAVRWLRANAETYGIDSEKIGAAGLSAGGHLVALLATSGGVAELEGDGGNPEQNSVIQAAVPMGAQTDFLSERNRQVSAEKEIWQAFLGGSQEQQPGRYRLASPLTHLDSGDPPVAFLSGEFDDPSTHAERFRNRMAELGLDTDFTAIPGAPHAFMGGQEWFDFCIDKTDAFLSKHLKH